MNNYGFRIIGINGLITKTDGDCILGKPGQRTWQNIYCRLISKIAREVEKLPGQFDLFVNTTLIDHEQLLPLLVAEREAVDITVVINSANANQESPHMNRIKNAIFHVWAETALRLPYGSIYGLRRKQTAWVKRVQPNNMMKTAFPSNNTETTIEQVIDNGATIIKHTTGIGIEPVPYLVKQRGNMAEQPVPLPDSTGTTGSETGKLCDNCKKITDTQTYACVDIHCTRANLCHDCRSLCPECGIWTKPIEVESKIQVELLPSNTKAQSLRLEIWNGDRVWTLKEEIAKAMTEKRTTAKTYPIGPTLISLKDPSGKVVKLIKAVILSHDPHDITLAAEIHHMDIKAYKKAEERPVNEAHKYDVRIGHLPDQEIKQLRIKAWVNIQENQNTPWHQEEVARMWVTTDSQEYHQHCGFWGFARMGIQMGSATSILEARMKKLEKQILPTTATINLEEEGTRQVHHCTRRLFRMAQLLKLCQQQKSIIEKAKKGQQNNHRQKLWFTAQEQRERRRNAGMALLPVSNCLLRNTIYDTSLRSVFATTLRNFDKWLRAKRDTIYYVVRYWKFVQTTGTGIPKYLDSDEDGEITPKENYKNKWGQRRAIAPHFQAGAKAPQKISNMTTNATYEVTTEEKEFTEVQMETEESEAQCTLTTAPETQSLEDHIRNFGESIDFTRPVDGTPNAELFAKEDGLPDTPITAEQRHQMGLDIKNARDDRSTKKAIRASLTEGKGKTWPNSRLEKQIQRAVNNSQSNMDNVEGDELRTGSQRRDNPKDGIRKMETAEDNEASHDQAMDEVKTTIPTKKDNIMKERIRALSGVPAIRTLIMQKETVEEEIQALQCKEERTNERLLHLKNEMSNQKEKQLEWYQAEKEPADEHEPTREEEEAADEDEAEEEPAETAEKYSREVLSEAIIHTKDEITTTKIEVIANKVARKALTKRYNLLLESIDQEIAKNRRTTTRPKWGAGMIALKTVPTQGLRYKIQVCLVEDTKGRLQIPKGKLQEKEEDTAHAASRSWQQETTKDVRQVNMMETTTILHEKGYEFFCATWNTSTKDGTQAWKVGNEEEGKVQRAGWFQIDFNKNRYTLTAPDRYISNRLAKWQRRLVIKAIENNVVQEALQRCNDHAIKISAQPQHRDQIRIHKATLALGTAEEAKRTLGKALYEITNEQIPELANRITGTLMLHENAKLAQILENKERTKKAIHKTRQLIIAMDEARKQGFQHAETSSSQPVWIPKRKCKQGDISLNGTGNNQEPQFEQEYQWARENIQVKTTHFWDADDRIQTVRETMIRAQSHGRPRWSLIKSEIDYSDDDSADEGQQDKDEITGIETPAHMIKWRQEQMSQCDEDEEKDQAKGDQTDETSTGHMHDPTSETLQLKEGHQPGMLLGREHELEKAALMTLEEEAEETGTTTGFDQFKQPMYTTKGREPYSDNLYSTELDKSAFTPEEQAEVDAIATAIENGVSFSSTDNTHGDNQDEEEKFSAVPRTLLMDKHQIRH